MRKILIFLAAVAVWGGCSSYHKLLRTGTPEQKLEAAKQYYEKAEYHRALTLLEDVLVEYRTGQRADEVIYYLGATHFQLGNYLSAAYHFKQVYEHFPGSPHAEEALFYYGYALYLASPPIELDQTNTEQAIEVLELFESQYPESRYVRPIDSFLVALHRKLEMKDIRQAYVYHKIEDYKAVVWLVNYLLTVYPATPEKERLMYIRVVDAYHYAAGSVPNKQPERFRQVVRYGRAFLSSFPNSKFAAEVNGLVEKAQRQIEKSTSDENSTAAEVSEGN